MWCFSIISYSLFSTFSYNVISLFSNILFSIPSRAQNICHFEIWHLLIVKIYHSLEKLINKREIWNRNWTWLFENINDSTNSITDSIWHSTLSFWWITRTLQRKKTIHRNLTRNIVVRYLRASSIINSLNLF